MKSVILEVIGEIPRVHSLREVLGVFAASMPEAKELISGFIRNNRDKLRALEDAYISSMYLPSTRKIFQLGKEMLRKCRR
jgi:HEPN domain-containing protein